MPLFFLCKIHQKNDGNEKGAAENASGCLIGKGTHMVHALALSDEGGAPEKGGDQEHNIAHELLRFFHRNTVGKLRYMK